MNMLRNKWFGPALRVCTLVGVFFVSIASTAAQSESWHLDPAHSAAQFSVRHLGISTVRGAFTKVSGDAKYFPSDPGKSSIDVSIDATSVDTRVDMRDNDLRSARFLDAAKYPTITFKSKQVAAGAPGQLKVTGDLTLHGVTKEVVLDVDGPTAPITAMGSSRMGASASVKINRTDFGMTTMVPMIGDEITITIDVELVQPLAPSAGAPGQAAPPNPH
jgi:polyisoprenoid-binding protein YceI